MTTKVLLLLGLLAAAAAESREDSRQRYDSPESYESEEAKYDFSYQVKDDDGNDFGHAERRDDDFTEGAFYVRLADGRMKRVKYYVDGDSGFVADVQYSGEARYDSHSFESRESGEYRESPRFYRFRDDSNESK